MEKEKKKIKFYTIAIENQFLPIFLVISVIGLWLFCWLSVYLWVGATDVTGWAKKGQFGDLFGSVNALFSGLAFAGIIYSIMQQQKELELTRTSVELGIDEQKRGNEEFKKQNKTIKSQNTAIKRQRFEGTFFNMLNIHFKLLESVYHPPTNRYGAIALQDFSERFIEYYKNLVSVEIDDAYANIYLTVFIDRSSPYIQSLTSLHTSIKESKFKSDVEKRYLELLKSYISFAERKFLYYHILLGYNPDLLKLNRDLKIVEEFPARLLFDPNHHLFISKFQKKLNGD